MSLFKLFLIYVKIGAILLGGGYVILPIMTSEFVDKRNLISHDDLIDYFALAQSLPGIIAANTAIFPLTVGALAIAVMCGDGACAYASRLLGLNEKNKALKSVETYEGLIIHSDQGWHYQHKHYRHTLKKNKIIQSMSRKGNCLDNSIMESFFGTLKNEFFYNNNFTSIEEFKIELDKYIYYYNNDRIKYRLNGLSPVKYRTQTV